jgi:hypothetical protein
MDRRPCTDFVASFSENGDLLSQWRSYCPDGNGVCIGFKSDALSTHWIADPSGGKSAFVGYGLHRVKYLSGTNDGSLAAEIDRLLELCERAGNFEGLQGRVDEEGHFLGWIAYVASRCKHAAFSEEQEWRLTMLKPHKPMPHQRFRAGKSMLLPYVEVEVNRKDDYQLNTKYFITEVRISPTPNESLARASVERLFASAGHAEVKVIPSAIPYRHW